MLSKLIATGMLTMLTIICLSMVTMIAFALKVLSIIIFFIYGIWIRCYHLTVFFFFVFPCVLCFSSFALKVWKGNSLPYYSVTVSVSFTCTDEQTLCSLYTFMYIFYKCIHMYVHYILLFICMSIYIMYYIHYLLTFNLYFDAFCIKKKLLLCVKFTLCLVFAVDDIV